MIGYQNNAKLKKKKKQKLLSLGSRKLIKIGFKKKIIIIKSYVK